MDGPWRLGEQMRAHCVGVEEPEVSRAHSGCAVTPAGAAGQGAAAEQDGEQKEPASPVICTESEPAGHGPSLGSAYALPPGDGPGDGPGGGGGGGVGPLAGK